MIKDEKANLNSMLGNNAQLIGSLSALPMLGNEYSREILRNLLIEYFMKKEVQKINRTSLRIISNISINGSKYLSEVLNLCKFKITEIDLSSNKMEFEGFQYICNSLKKIKTVKGVNFTQNRLQSNSFEFLSENLPYDYEKLNLSFNEAEVNGCSFLSNYIQKNQKLSELKLSNNKCKEDGIRFLCQALNKHSNITFLDFSKNDLNDNSMKFISEFLMKNKSIKSLDLNSNKITTIGLDFICEGLCENSNLESLNLSGNKFPFNNEVFERFEIFLSNAVYLKSLNLKNCQITSDSVLLISQALEINTNLTELLLGNNKISDLGVGRLFKSLIRNQTLQTLDVSYTECTDDCAESICFFLQNNDTLKNLNISGNALSESFIESIADGLRANNCIEKLEMNENEVGDHGCRILCKLTQNQSYLRKLQNISLDLCNISSEGATELFQLISQDKISCLNIKGNNIDNSCIPELSKAIFLSNSIQIIDISNNTLKDEHMQTLIDSIIQNSSLTWFDISKCKLTKKMINSFQQVKNYKSEDFSLIL
jgi:Ran GTPase-activating protein (RanGAP) involved in mRNA processing and transport